MSDTISVVTAPHAAPRLVADTFGAVTPSTADREIAHLSRAVWLLITAMAVIAAAALPLLGLSLDVATNPTLLAISVGYAALVFFYRYVRRDPTIAGPLEAAGQLFVVLFLGLLLTYAATAPALPLRDAELWAIDQWMGFDRQAFRRGIAAIPGLESLLDWAYLSIQPQVALIPFILIAAGRLPHLLRFVLALGIALVVTSLIAVFVPALSATIYVDLAPLREAGIPPGAYTHIPTLLGLRSGTLTAIPLNNLEGLITFPSFHTAIAILYAWALWPLRLVRWVGLLVNALMILSVPLSGSHYVIDLIGGAAVAALAIAAATRVARPTTSPP